MRKIHFFLVLSLLAMQPTFANEMKSEACDTIVKACLKAGFKDHKNGDKKFWMNCMRPVLLNETVKGVTVDAETVKTCRTDKIAKMKQEIADFEKVSDN